MSSAASDSEFLNNDEDQVARNLDQIIHSNTYKLAHQDLDLLNSASMRGVRMLLEISKPELQLEEAGIRSTIIVFGGARIQERAVAESSLEQSLMALSADPDSSQHQRRVHKARKLVELSAFYDAAREFAFLASRHGQPEDGTTQVVHLM